MLEIIANVEAGVRVLRCQSAVASSLDTGCLISGVDDNRAERVLTCRLAVSSGVYEQGGARCVASPRPGEDRDNVATIRRSCLRSRAAARAMRRP